MMSPRVPRQAACAFLAVLSCCVAAAAEERILYEGESPFSHIIVTENDRGLRTLLFDRSGVRQSVVKLGDPDHIELAYARSILVALAVCERPERMLVVGLGGGTLPSLLHQHYPQAAIDVVDIDPGVVEVAGRFFGFHTDQRLRVHVCDGRQFIEEARQPYDIIFLDAFGSSSIPRHLTTREFLEAVRNALRPTGVVAANIWGPGANSLYHSMIRTYQEAFGSLLVLRVPASTNEILLAQPRRVDVRREVLVRRAAAVTRDKSLRYDLGELLAAGWQDPPPLNERGRVLTDADTADDNQ